MTRRRAVAVSLPVWLLVGAFWFVTTRHRHPTHRLAVITTAAIVVALAVIRSAYERVVGPEPDPVRTWVTHFGIDLLGMGVHLVAAAALVRLMARRGW